MSPPVLEEQLLSLSPRGRMLVGAIMVPVGALVAIALWDRGVVWYATVFAVLFGGVLVASGWREQQRQAAIDAEVARAQREWPDLQRVVAAARSTGQNVARLLQQRGYREYAVRRWLVRELGG